MIRQTTAAQVPACGLVLDPAGNVGIMLGDGGVIPGALDQSQTRAVLILRAGPHSGHKRGDVAIYSHAEGVVQVGEVRVTDLSQANLLWASSALAPARDDG